MSRIPADPVLDPAPLSAVPVEVATEHPVVPRLAVDGTLGARVRRGVSVTAVAQALLLVIDSAPLVARSCDDPRITPPVQLAGLWFVLDVAAVPFALLQRSMRYRQLSTTEVVAAPPGSSPPSGSPTPEPGPTRWSSAPLVQVVMLDVLLCSTVRRRPHHSTSRDELCGLRRSGRGVTGADVMHHVGISIDTVLIGQASPRPTSGWTTAPTTPRTSPATGSPG